MANIVISGTGISFDWCPLSVKNFKRLTNQKKPEVTHWELLTDLLDGPKFESYSNIFNGDCELWVDEKLIQSYQLPSGTGKKIRSLIEYTKTKKYYLIREVSQGGYWHEWNVEKFDPARLNVSLERVRISKKHTYDCLEIDYAGLSWDDDLGNVNSTSNYEYVIDGNGNCHEIFLAKDNEDLTPDPNAAWPF